MRLYAPVLLVAFGHALGCEQIAGIEERKFVESTSAVSELCSMYCDDAVDHCEPDHRIYANEETCLGVCALLDEGDPNEPTGNTVACRADQARLAGIGEPEEHCINAAAGGNDQCGENCEGYCELFSAACPDDPQDQSRCIEHCRLLRDTGTVDLSEDYAGDTLQCRLAHLSAATLEPDPHCEHARLFPTAPCVDSDDETPACEDYCRLVMAACTGEQAVYDNHAQCLAACGALDIGAPSDISENTVGCRTYHSYAALLAVPKVHCPHAGPSGDGNCGEDEEGSTGNCVSYCSFFEQACESEFFEAYADQSECRSRCSEEFSELGAEAGSSYSLEFADSSGTLQCRTIHAVRAFEDPDACSMAAGGGECGAPSD